MKSATHNPVNECGSPAIVRIAPADAQVVTHPVADRAVGLAPFAPSAILKGDFECNRDFATTIGGNIVLGPSACRSHQRVQHGRKPPSRWNRATGVPRIAATPSCLSPLNLLKTMQLKNRRSSLDIGTLPALFQADSCVLSKVEIPMKFKVMQSGSTSLRKEPSMANQNVSSLDSKRVLVGAPRHRRP